MTRIDKRQTSLSIFDGERRASVLINTSFCSVKIRRQETIDSSLSCETPNLDNSRRTPTSCAIGELETNTKCFDN